MTPECTNAGEKRGRLRRFNRHIARRTQGVIESQSQYPESLEQIQMLEETIPQYQRNTSIKDKSSEPVRHSANRFTTSI